MIKRFSSQIFVFILTILISSACRKTPEEAGLSWQEKYTGNYLFLTIHRNDTYQTADTVKYNGKIDILDEIKHLIKIYYAPGKTLSPYIYSDGGLYIENSGSHSGFTGKFDRDGNVEFILSLFNESWHVTGEKL